MYIYSNILPSTPSRKRGQTPPSLVGVSASSLGRDPACMQPQRLRDLKSQKSGLFHTSSMTLCGRALACTSTLAPDVLAVLHQLHLLTLGEKNAIRTASIIYEQQQQAIAFCERVFNPGLVHQHFLLACRMTTLLFRLPKTHLFPQNPLFGHSRSIPSFSLVFPLAALPDFSP